MEPVSLLKELDAKYGLFQSFDVVLNLGAGNGSFAEYAITKCQKIYGFDAPAVCQSHKAKLSRILKEHNSIKIGQGDIYSSVPRVVTKGEEVDIILNTLPLHLIQSVKALENYLPVLKNNGRVLLLVDLEGQAITAVKPFVERLLAGIKLSEIQFLESDQPSPKEKVFVLAKNKRLQPKSGTAGPT